MGNYIQEADVRAESVPSTIGSAIITRRIAKWEAIVEQITRNIFRVISPGELTFDGNDSDILHFNIPLVSVTSVIINEETTALPTTDYKSYTGNSPPRDDRKNPKIRLVPQRQSIFAKNRNLFIRGLDQKITATWGYVETGGVTPQPIKDALVELVVLDLDGYFDRATTGGGFIAAASPVRREKTDGHEIEYQQLVDVKRMWTILPQTIAEILALYRAPWAITAPGLPQYLDEFYAGASIYSQ